MTTKTRANTTKAGDERVHRLTEIVVEEVSMVDRAANKRKFLVVKRSDEMGAELTPDGKGGFTAATPATQQTKAGACPPAGDKKKPAMKALELPPGAKQMMGPLLEKAAERLKALADEVSSSKDAEVPEEGGIPPIPEEFWSELVSICDSLAQLDTMYPKAPAAPEEGEPPPAEGEPAPAEMQMAAKALVAKFGAKMSKERLSRFEQALSVLGSILQELRPQAGEAAAPSEMQMSAKGPARKEAPAPQANDELKKGLEKMATMLTSVVGTVKKQSDELAAIKKSRGQGNGLTIEGGPSRRETQEVSWPLDMNSPVTRDNVHKQESFFDD
ncbi:MAG: hypothetical protein EPO42_14390 [Gallionellaceae bacterium]|nr:MAG: hypothetical protein EPO42_14390 [Gallionellaceae bacterium]